MLDVHVQNEETRVEMKKERRDQVKYIRDNFLNNMEKQEKKDKANLAKLAKKQMAEV